jgi:hypothetical protein
MRKSKCFLSRLLFFFAHCPFWVQVWVRRQAAVSPPPRHCGPSWEAVTHGPGKTPAQPAHSGDNSRSTRLGGRAATAITNTLGYGRFGRRGLLGSNSLRWSTDSASQQAEGELAPA